MENTNNKFKAPLIALKYLVSKANEKCKHLL
jgi:hypothetical protein